MPLLYCDGGDRNHLPEMVGERNVKLGKIWDALRSSYWFLPGLMALFGIGLAFAALALDRSEKLAIGKSWIYTGGPEGARAVLSAIASSTISVAATAFSITIVALQLAASNFGPRLLRNFMQDLGNQIVLGTFIGTFLYCLLVLRSIYGEDYNLFVPQLAVTIAMILAIASIGVLIYFIHHASTIIQASHIIGEVAVDLEQTMQRLFPAKLGQGPPDAQPPAIPKDFWVQACPIAAKHTGYLQAIDEQLLLKNACKHGLLLQLQCHLGEFIIAGNPLVMVYPADCGDEKFGDRLNSAFILGRERTEQQDISFPINQLVEIALRALSPGINDPYTAIRCIDRLSAGLSHLAEREFPSPYRYDETGHLRIIAQPIAFEHLVNEAFTQIRHYGQEDVVVMKHLLRAIARIASRASRPQDRFALERHAEMVWQASQEGLSQEKDRQDMEAQYRQVLLVLKVDESANGSPQRNGDGLLA